MQSFKRTLKGVAPLMCHNERLANPMNPFTRELKKLTAQRQKSDELIEQIQKLEWRAGLYDVDGRVVIPSANVLATLKEGARKIKKGKEVSAGVIAPEAYFTLIYDGPKVIEKLWEDERFRDYRCVGVQGKRVMRSRPVFPTWSLNVDLLFAEDIIQEHEIEQAFTLAGERIGLCEHRPQFGRFVVDA